MEYPNPQLFDSWQEWASTLLLALTEAQKIELADKYVGVDCSGGPVTVDLVSAAVAGRGQITRVKDESGDAGTNNITVDPSGSETIDGSATYVINTNYGKVTLRSNGFNWVTV